ncbi:MAG: GNAT family N-acetyltransferase [Candidatus Dojkabacteria bacterium]|nr:MAG: GNAT family N-acetyltransferase [Candidatus Dojkabacteria bacterium]
MNILPATQQTAPEIISLLHRHYSSLNNEYLFEKYQLDFRSHPLVKRSSAEEGYTFFAMRNDEEEVIGYISTTRNDNLGEIVEVVFSDETIARQHCQKLLDTAIADLKEHGVTQLYFRLTQQNRVVQQILEQKYHAKTLAIEGGVDLRNLP